MAKPRELFNTPAPQAMSQMGQGIADAYARAGAIEGAGYKALGEGLAQGITQAASAYAGAKQTKSDIKSFEAIGKNPIVSEAVFGPATKGADGQIITTANKAASFYESVNGMGLSDTEKLAVYKQTIPMMMSTNMQTGAVLQQKRADYGYDIGKQDNSAYNQAGLYGVQAMLGNRSYPAPVAGAGMPSMMPSAVPYGSQPVSNGTAFDPRKLDIRMGGSWQ
jgi:hypothetical protein